MTSYDGPLVFLRLVRCTDTKCEYADSLPAVFGADTEPDKRTAAWINQRTSVLSSEDIHGVDPQALVVNVKGNAAGPALGKLIALLTGAVDGKPTRSTVIPAVVLLSKNATSSETFTTASRRLSEACKRVFVVGKDSTAMERLGAVKAVVEHVLSVMADAKERPATEEKTR